MERHYSSWLVVITTILIALTPATNPIQMAHVSASAAQREDQYVLVGGQNGKWFNTLGQTPRLYRIFPSNHSITTLGPLPSVGAVWTGSWNGSQWLISGWGATLGTNGSNPYIYLYDGQSQIVAGTRNLWRSEASWHGGDIFAASYNGSEWLLSGLGSDWLPSGWGSQSTGKLTNHMALALFDGYRFTDLSAAVPNQWDAVLFANAWNGHFWLVGGGWQGNEGVLYRYDGANFTDLSSQLESAMWMSGRVFHSVQAIEWNGDYWLLGGVGFLAKYDGWNFTDLTPALNAALGPRHALSYALCCNAVNALAWNGDSWQIGGGAPVTTPQQMTAWAASFDGERFTDLTPLIPSYIASNPQGSSILTITYTRGSWFFGGYANDTGFLLSYANSTMTNLSGMIKDKMTVVNWVGGWPDLPHETSSPIGTLGTYIIAPIVILTIASALAIMYRKHNHRAP